MSSGKFKVNNGNIIAKQDYEQKVLEEENRELKDIIEQMTKEI